MTRLALIVLLVGCATELSSEVPDVAPLTSQGTVGFQPSETLQDPAPIQQPRTPASDSAERAPATTLEPSVEPQPSEPATGRAEPEAPAVDPPESTAPAEENAPPTGGAALLSSAEVVEGDVLTCAASGALDPEGDPVNWLYAWFVSGEKVQGQTGDTLDSTHFNKGDEVWCVAIPSDGQLSGQPVTSKNSAFVLNTPPSLQAAALAPPEVSEDGSFDCTWTGLSDPDPADSPSVEYAWETVTGATLVGQASSSLGASILFPGQSIRCLVTPVDAESAGAPVLSGPGTVVQSGPTCQDLSQQLNLTAQEVPPSILLVVDRSGSMYDSWGQTKVAVGQVLSDLGPEAQTGLMLYPSAASCTVAETPQVPFGADQADVVVAAMNEAGTGGSTPMGRAMRSARQYLEITSTANTTVVLAADGKPSDTCLQDCTGCDCTDESTCLWCADLVECTLNEVRKEVSQLQAMGVRTFVIGYKGGFGASDFLESLAAEGGTADLGDSPFYDAADGSNLANALEDITSNLQVCATQVTMPPAWDALQVTVGSTLLVEDSDDGYALSDDGTLHLFGSACDAAKSASVSVQFACN